MKNFSFRLISFLLALTMVLGMVPVLRMSARAWTVNQQNIADRADFFFNTTWVCQKTVYGWRDQYTFYEGETYHLPYGQPVNSGKFIGYGVELEDFLIAAADGDSVFYSTQSEYNGWTSVYYATDCAAFVAMCWGTVRQDCSTLPYYSTYKGMATESNIYNILQLGDALDSTSVGHVVLVTDMTYDASGNLIQIEITEQTPPQLKRTYFTPAELAEKYGAEFGIYRYEGSVPAVPEWGYASECTPYASHCRIVITDDAPIMTLPCHSSVNSESALLQTAAAGSEFTATRLYENTAGELWYRVALSDDEEGYLPAGSTRYLEQILEDISLTDSVPPSAHVAGNTYSLVGNIYSRYNQLITASAYIRSGFGGDGIVLTGYEDYVTGNAYTLKNSTIDYNTSMGSLSTGKHTYTVSTTYRNYYVTEDGSCEMNTGTVELAEDYFMVISRSVTQSSCNHSYSETLLGEQTCTEGSRTIYACGTCGLVNIQTGEAAGHSFGEWVSQPPTCTEDGFADRSCSTCGETESQVLPATGHDYLASEQSGNCRTYPHTAYTCSNCGDCYKVYPDSIMSQWMTELPEGIDPELVQTKLQYRSSALETLTSPDVAPDGYFLVREEWEASGTGSAEYVASWPSGFDTTCELYAQYNREPVSESETDAEKLTVDSSAVTGYLYYHWCYDGYPYTSATKQGSYNTFHAFYSTTDPASHDRYDPSDSSYSFSNEGCSNSTWFFVTEVTTQSYTTYHKLYTYGKWSDYCEWTDEEILATDTLQVESRTLYRYANGELGEHSFENGICSICGAAEEHTEHSWAEGVCGICGATCTHTWVEGVCDTCGAACVHAWVEGVCDTCGVTCTHTWVEGVCDTCGVACTHIWVEGTCDTCGAACVHAWVEGVCSVCGIACAHDWNEGVCIVCGVICKHSYENGICTVCSLAEPSVTPVVCAKYASLSFEDEVLVNIYFTVSNLGSIPAENLGLLTWTSPLPEGTVANAGAVIPGAVYNSETGLYSVNTQGIAAKNLSDTIYFKIYVKLADGSYVYTKLLNYSPMTYAESILNDANYSTEMKSLVVAMLNYGAAAQTYFSYKPYMLMNADLTAEEAALVENYRSDMISPVVAADSLKLGTFASTGTGFAGKYPSITFESAFAIEYYFTADTVVYGEMTLYYWTAEDYQNAEILTEENASGKIAMNGDTVFSAAVTDIAAKNLEDTVYVSAVYSDGTTTHCSGVLAYSIGAYCVSLAAGTTSMQPLAAATAVYGYYARRFFAE